MMQYISPFHFLPEDIIQSNLIDSSQIKLIRKKIMAEIDLSETQSIIINDRELTKFDIINLFDSLNDAQLLISHFYIYKNKPILDFLEKGIFTQNINAFQYPILNNEMAINLISPYYKEVSIDLLNNAIAQKDVATIKNFFAITHFLNNEDTFELFEYVTKKLHVLCNCFNEMQLKMAANEKVTLDDFNNLDLNKIIVLLNSLPDDFDKLREDVAFDLNALGCDFINNSYNDLAESLFGRAISLKSSDHIQSYFKSNLATAQNNSRILSSKSSNKKSSSSNTGYPIIFIVIVILRIIFAVSKCSSSSEYTPTVNYINYPAKQEEIIPDYLEKKDITTTESFSKRTNL